MVRAIISPFTMVKTSSPFVAGRQSLLPHATHTAAHLSAAPLRSKVRPCSLGKLDVAFLSQARSRCHSRAQTIWQWETAMASALCE